MLRARTSLARYNLILNIMHMRFNGSESSGHSSGRLNTDAVADPEG